MGSTVAMDQYICGTTQGLLFFWSFYAVLKHANQSTNFCFTTLESWNFVVKREVLVIDICGKFCCLFSTKNVCGFCQMQWLPFPSLGCITMVNCIIPTGFSWILCKSNPQQHQNKQAENSQDVAVSGLRKCQADTPWNFLLGLNWWVIFCNAMKSEWEYSSSFVRPSPSNFFFRVWFISLIFTLNIAIM